MSYVNWSIDSTKFMLNIISTLRVSCNVLMLQICEAIINMISKILILIKIIDMWGIK